jgi:hypothetical protein
MGQCLDCESGYEWGTADNNTCMLECEDHLTRNSATDVCECSDITHSEVNVASGTVCARDCIADEERSDIDPYCQCLDTHEYAIDGVTCIELC